MPLRYPGKPEFLLPLIDTDIDNLTRQDIVHKDNKSFRLNDSPSLVFEVKNRLLLPLLFSLRHGAHYRWQEATTASELPAAVDTTMVVDSNRSLNRKLPAAVDT